MQISFTSGGGTRGLGRILVGLLAAAVVGLALSAPASAEMQRPLLYSFGKDAQEFKDPGKTERSTFEEISELAFQQADNKLYVQNLQDGIWGFHVPSAGTYNPFGATPFIPMGYPGPGHGMDVDNSTLNSKGRVYMSTQFGRLVDAWDETGAHMPAPFPILTPPPDNPNGIAVDSQGNFMIANQGNENALAKKGVLRWNRFGSPLPNINTVNQPNGTTKVAFDSEDNLYVGTGQLWKYTAASAYTESIPIHPDVGTNAVDVDKTSDTLFIAAGENVWEYDKEGDLIRKFGDTFGVVGPSPSGIAINEATGEIYVSISNQVRVFGAPVLMPDLTTKRPHSVTTTAAVVNGHVDLDGGPPVTECFFQYGTDESYGEPPKPCAPAVSPGEPIEGEADVSAQLINLSPGSTVNYRIVTKTANGYHVGENETLIARDPPQVKGGDVLEVTSDNAQLRAEVNPQGVPSTYHYEYGPEDCSVSVCQATPPVDIVKCTLFSCPPTPNAFVLTPIEIGGLQPGQIYHFRAVSSNNQAGVGYGPDRTFRTFDLDPSGIDPCPNANERKQSQGGKLSRCRAYELVSAADAAGYDVLSNIVTGREPLNAYPQADDRFLYTMQDGKLPGIAGFPVNLGTDPYVAERGPEGWTTTYPGLPATTPSASPFASTASGADATLSAFAFAEPDVCDPCFADGSGGIPLRLPSGELVQGMQGSIPVALPEAAGDVAKYLSEDGQHFVFGSEQKFEPAGNAGSVSIYDRNLDSGLTQVVSTMPNGATMTGDVAQLDMSPDGHRILIGKRVRTDAQGNDYYDLYMHIGTSPNSVLVADTLTGVLYNGMTDEGTEVFFTTTDVLADDADTSADLFRADVGTVSSTLTRVSTGSGATGQSDECTPPEDWNVSEGGSDCSTLGFAGGGGIGGEEGTAYFVSPEQLDGAGNGLPNQPNLYAVAPGSATPEFVALLDNSAAKPPPQPPKRPLLNDPLISGTSGPNSIAIDQQNGAVYVVESNQGRFSRFTAAGAQFPFTAGPGAGTNKISLGFGQGFVSETGIGIDRSPSSPLTGSIYVKENTSTVGIYAQTGERIGEFFVPAELCGLAVDPTNGDVYTSAYPNMKRYRPISATLPIDNTDFEETGLEAGGLGVCQVAVDSIGNVYGSNWSQGPVRQFKAADFAPSSPNSIGTLISESGFSMSTDPVTNQLYVAKGNHIGVYEPNGELDGTVGTGSLTNSRAVAVRASNRFTYAASNNNRIKLFGYEEFPYVEIDHPALEHGTDDAYRRFSDDIQITPDGDHAVFQTRIGQAGAEANLLQHVYHHRVSTGQLDCVSCKPTGALGIGDAFLAPNGTNMSDDGRVFFTSLEQLTLRDTNRRTDAYEWEEAPPGGVADLNLISTGTGITNAGLASVDSSGKNAYFFTRETIVPTDDNGPVMKVYTAREGGGYGYLPQGVQCQAADECRGPGTEVAPPPAIGTYKGSGGNLGPRPKSCRKGFKKKNGKCVKKKRKRAGRKARANRGGRR